MANLTFNIAKGRVAAYAELPGTNDALIVVPLEADGLVSDGTMRDYESLDDVLSGASNEQTDMGRETATNVVVNVDHANDRVDVTMDDVTWESASGDDVGAVLVCYDPDTTASNDEDIIPLTKHDFEVSPNGGDITAQVTSGRFFRAE